MNKQLIHHSTSNISTNDIKVSYIYPESLPLEIVYIHEYNPIIDKIIAIKCNNYYMIIDRPIGNELLLRPHYYFGRGLIGNNIINVNAIVNDHIGNIILDKNNYQLNIHDNVCSPNNMKLDLSNMDKSLLLCSVVESIDNKISTYHFIPTEDQWSFIYKYIYSDIFNKNITTITELLSILDGSGLFKNDILFNDVKALLL